MAKTKNDTSASDIGANLGFEAKLWAAADALRNNMDAAEYTPPSNDSDWRGELLKDDKRGAYGVPPAGNANYAWVRRQ